MKASITHEFQLSNDILISNSVGNRKLEIKNPEENLLKFEFLSNIQSSQNFINPHELNQYCKNMDRTNMNNFHNIDFYNSQNIGNLLNYFLSIPIMNDIKLPDVGFSDSKNLYLPNSYPLNCINSYQRVTSKNKGLSNQEIQSISSLPRLFPGMPGYLCNMGSYDSFVPYSNLYETNQTQNCLNFENKEEPKWKMNNFLSNFIPQSEVQDLNINIPPYNYEFNQVPSSYNKIQRTLIKNEETKQNQHINPIDEKEMLNKMTPHEIHKYKIEKFKQKKIRFGWISGKKKCKNVVVCRKYRVNGKFVKKAKALELINIPLKEIASNKFVLKIMNSKSDYALSATVEGVTFYNFDNFINDEIKSGNTTTKENSLIEVKLIKIDHHRKTIQISIGRKKEEIEFLELCKQKDVNLNLLFLNYILPKPVYQVYRNNLNKVPMIHFEQHYLIKEERKNN